MTKSDIVLQAARNWWKGKRPLSWSYLSHLQNPTVNTTSASESNLAQAVALWLREEDGPFE